MVEIHLQSDVYKDYASKLLKSGTLKPRNGDISDGFHQPIHPIKCALKGELGTSEWLVYDFITRHFLASLSKDAVGNEKTVRVKMGREYFTINTLDVQDKNYLEIYSFDSWSKSSLIPDDWKKGMKLQVDSLTLVEGKQE